MILDVLASGRRYLELNEGFAKAFEFLARPDLKELPAGRYGIDGERVYATVSKDPGRKREDAQLEAHEKFIDIQLVLSGTDVMGWKPRSSCAKPSGEYDQKSDLQFFTDEPDVWITTRSGAFVIFSPDDAHMPSISSGTLHKVVVKVAVV
jgi:biofilm protein TabA